MNRTKIIDLLSRKNVYGMYDEYLRTQWFSEKDMRIYQLNKLKRLLMHCKKNVPFYRSIIEKNNINIEKIDSIDILQLFPIITKEIIQDNYKDFTPLNLDKIRGVKVSQTGGTTGNILYKRTDANVRSSTWATFKRFQDWMHISKKDKILRLMGGHVAKFSIKDFVKHTLSDMLSNTISLNPYDKSDKNIEKIKRVLQNENTNSIRGYSQGMFFLANKFKEENLSFDINSITTTAEPLMDEHRAIFKEVFGANSFDQYGCGEIGGIAYECDHHKGLHIAEERVIIEFKDEYDLLITDLDNFSMPYIRYWNADQAILSTEKCSCGRESLILKKIMGRTCDYISCPNGKQLHWAYFWHLLFDTGIAAKKHLKKFQVLQKSKTDFDFRVVSETLSKDDKLIITNNMKEKIDENINIVFIQETDIENAASGKFRPVINQTI